MATLLPANVKCTAEECHRTVEMAHSLHPILGDPSAVADRARVFQAMGSETRLQILGLLSVREMCVCNLVAALGTAASTLAHHLRMLEDAGLITARRDGKFTLYALNEAPLQRHRALE
jgi:DNA-binding transcriptional ArsR family regulator